MNLVLNWQPNFHKFLHRVKRDSLTSFRPSVLGTVDCRIRAPLRQSAVSFCLFYIPPRFYSTLNPEKCHLLYTISGNELFGRRVSQIKLACEKGQILHAGRNQGSVEAKERKGGIF